MKKHIKPETPKVFPKGFPLLTETNGKGHWTNTVREVKITGFKVDYISDDTAFASLNAYFDLETWDTQYGLIYTDPAWIRSFREALVKQLDIPQEVADSISYSEQGLQGDDYVNLDCGEAFYIFLNSDKADRLGRPPIPTPKAAKLDPITELEEWLDARSDNNVSEIMHELVEKVRAMQK